MRTRQIDIDPDDLPPIPHVPAAVAATEIVAMKAMKTVATAATAQIKGDIHDRSGTLSKSVGSSVRRLPGGGVSVRFGSIKKVAFMTRKGDRATRELYGGEGGKTKKQGAFHADFVDRGTGTRGPLHKRIARVGLFPVGNQVLRPSGIGQAPQGMFRRARDWFAAQLPALDEQIDDDLTRRIEGRRR